MKKTILFSLLGGIILFAWQFISFAMPNLHKSSQSYTPLQDEILAAIKESGLKQGMYNLAQPDPSLKGEEMSAAMEKLEGQPWAILNYRESYSGSMTLNMIRGLIITILTSYIFLLLVRQQKDPKLLKRLGLGLGVGMISFFFVPYANFIWFKEPDIWAYLADGIVPWLALGWLGHKMA